MFSPKDRIEWRERLARLVERTGVPGRVNNIVPRRGTTNPQVTRACKAFWAPYDRLFPRRCEFCIHFDSDLAKKSLAGQLCENEADGANVVAQRLLMNDYVWDVDGKEVRISLDALGGCAVREAYTVKEGSCDQFARTSAGSVDSGKRPGDAEQPAGLHGWRPGVNTRPGNQGTDQGGDQPH